MDFRAIFMGLAFALMWSSAFTSARIIVTEAPPMAALAARFLLSGLVGCGLAAALGQSLRLSAAQWRGVIIFGLCQNAIYLGLNFIAMQWVGASVASIIASTMPLIVAGLSWIVLRDRMKPLGLAGLVLGILGVAIIMGARLSGGISPMGVALCFAGAMALAVATLAVRGATSGGNVLMTVGLQMFVGAIPLSLLSAFFEPHDIIYTPKLVIAFLYTALVPGVLATWVWFLLVERLGPIKAATFHFLNPFFGVALAAIILHEPLGLGDFIGVAVITLGIIAVQYSKRSPSQLKLTPSTTQEPAPSGH
ncbi:DMT family transporter [Thioclava sp. GXIMD4216]|uniref:DMT family transporter n=1 Tax=unclassified Thioclava TaxID=2621713 RepID=UPI0030CDE054